MQHKKVTIYEFVYRPYLNKIETKFNTYLEFKKYYRSKKNKKTILINKNDICWNEFYPRHLVDDNYIVLYSLTNDVEFCKKKLKEYLNSEIEELNKIVNIKKDTLNQIDKLEL